MKSAELYFAYEFHSRGVENVPSVRRHSDQMVRQLKEACPWDPDIEVHIEPESKRKGLFHVTLKISHFSQPFVIQKKGRQLIATLKKVKRTALRQIHRNQQKHTDLKSKRKPLRLVTP